MALAGWRLEGAEACLRMHGHRPCKDFEMIHFIPLHRPCFSPSNGVRLMIYKTSHFNTVTDTTYAGCRNSKRMTINGMMKRLCKEEDAGYVDLWDSFVGKEDMYVRDGLHLSGMRAAVFAEGLSGAVTSGFGKVGSIMGPFLFNIFINDIFYFVHECDLYGYADDNTLSKAAKDAASLKRALERDTANMLSWFTENYMSANPDKFQAIVLGMKNPSTVSSAKSLTWESIVSGRSLMYRRKRAGPKTDPCCSSLYTSSLWCNYRSESLRKYVLHTTMFLEKLPFCIETAVPVSYLPRVICQHVKF